MTDDSHAALGEHASPFDFALTPALRRPAPGVIPQPGSVIDQPSDLFFAAIESNGTPMVVTDPRQAHNPIVFANRAFCAMTGYAVEDGQRLQRKRVEQLAQRFREAV